MPILLYCVGAVAFAMGAAAIGYGIPINEFSFGNTLIISGAVFCAGGLVVLALGVVVSRVQQLAEALARGAPVRLGRVDAELQTPLRAAVQPGLARVPFPPKPKGPPPRPEAVPVTEAPPPEPMPEPVEFKVEPTDEDLPPPPPPLPRSLATPFLPKRPLREPEDVAPALSPLLPNPETEPEEPEERPERPVVAPTADLAEPPLFRSEPRSAADLEHDDLEKAAVEEERLPIDEPAPPVKAESGSFDAMWPASTKPEAAVKPREAAMETAGDDEADHDAMPQEEPRAVAVLKSGVVDGMGYTLYVDGSIEAELPQGTLRFASINELRAHLEKTA